MSAYEPTYWNNKGKYQNAHDKLWKILKIPLMGATLTADGEKLRKAANKYYDRFNNGVGRLPVEELDRRMDVLVKKLADKYIGGLQ